MFQFVLIGTYGVFLLLVWVSLYSVVDLSSPVFWSTGDYAQKGMCHVRTQDSEHVISYKHWYEHMTNVGQYDGVMIGYRWCYEWIWEWVQVSGFCDEVVVVYRFVKYSLNGRGLLSHILCKIGPHANEVFVKCLCLCVVIDSCVIQ